jgi:aspartate-semialdehyde dehydrogenase
MGYRVVVVGATGNVGREMLQILSERQFPLDEVAAVASSRSQGDIIDFGDGGEELKGQQPRQLRFRRLGHCAVRGRFGGQQAPRAARGGGRVHGDRQ